MAGRIPNDVIDKIRDETAIADVIGHYVTLQRKGATLWGLCPFHHEKTPSFHVRPDANAYYCFGCQRGGGVFQFLQEHSGMGFLEAVEWCADRLGLDLERYRSAETGPDPRAPMLEANAWAAKWFAEQLRRPEGAAALEYARDRGLSDDTIEAFGLGFAPAGWESLRQAAEAARMGLEPLLAASLLRAKEGQAPFAYFRSRLIFPVRGVAQKIHGFGGRILGAGEPKYLNSPESPVFRKRRTLYALPEARPSMVRRREAILVEGYLDALSLHQAGWTHVVATCGTAFTPEQAELLERSVDRLVMVFDGDPAGRKAAFKSADTALGAGLDVRIVKLPPGRDPADLLREGEGEVLAQALHEAPGLVQAMWQEVEGRGGYRTLKERALHHLRSTIELVPDAIRAQLLADEAAEVFSVPVRLLRPSGASRSARRGGEIPVPPTPIPESVDETLLDSERRLLGLAMGDRRARRRLFDRIAVEDFRAASHRELAGFLHGLEDPVERVDGSRLDDGLSAPALALAARLLMHLPGEDFDAVAELDAQLERLDHAQQERAARAARDHIDEDYRSGGDAWKGLLRSGADSQESDPTDPSHSDPHGGKPSS